MTDSFGRDSRLADVGSCPQAPNPGPNRGGNYFAFVQLASIKLWLRRMSPRLSYAEFGFECPSPDARLLEYDWAT